MFRYCNTLGEGKVETQEESIVSNLRIFLFLDVRHRELHSLKPLELKFGSTEFFARSLLKVRHFKTSSLAKRRTLSNQKFLYRCLGTVIPRESRNSEESIVS